METKHCQRCNTVRPRSAFTRDRSQSPRLPACCDYCYEDVRKKVNAAQRSSRHFIRPRKLSRVPDSPERLKRWGLSPSDFDALVKEQGGACYICKAQCSNAELLIDHNHTTGARRKLLCSACNTGLGLFRERTEILARAIEYLIEHQRIS